MRKAGHIAVDFGNYLVQHRLGRVDGGRLLELLVLDGSFFADLGLESVVVEDGGLPVVRGFGGGDEERLLIALGGLLEELGRGSLLGFEEL